MSESPMQPELLPEVGGSTVPVADDIKPKVDLQANEIIDQARELRDRVGNGVPDIEAYFEAIELDTSAKDLIPQAVEFFRSMKDAANKAHKEVVAKEKAVLKPLEDTREIAKKIMKDWRAIETKALAAPPDPDAQLAIEAARTVEVSQLESSGQVEAAKDLAAQPLPAERPAPGPARVEAPGISYRDSWTGVVKDFGRAAQSIAANPALRVTLLIINQSALDDAMQNSKGALQLDGIEAKYESVPVNRR